MGAHAQASEGARERSSLRMQCQKTSRYWHRGVVDRVRGLQGVATAKAIAAQKVVGLFGLARGAGVTGGQGNRLLALGL